LFPPDKPKVWRLGFSVGEQIREGKRQVHEHQKTHAGPRPHIRRAHWHNFWTGRRKFAADEQPVPQKLMAKWLPPVAVAMENDEED
jgi:hypothetical protein